MGGLDNEKRKQKCGNSSVGRAQPCQGWGREFESRFPLQERKSQSFLRLFCCLFRVQLQRAKTVWIASGEKKFRLFLFFIADCPSRQTCLLM